MKYSRFGYLKPGRHMLLSASGKNTQHYNSTVKCQSHISLNLDQVAPQWCTWTVSVQLKILFGSRTLYSHLTKALCLVASYKASILSIHDAKSKMLTQDVCKSTGMFFLFVCTCKDPKACWAPGRPRNTLMVDSAMQQNSNLKKALRRACDGINEKYQCVQY